MLKHCVYKSLPFLIWLYHLPAVQDSYDEKC